MKRILLFIACSLYSVTLYANGDWGKQIQVHGFASQGYVQTSHNRFFGPSDHGSFELTELGLNTSIKLTPNLRLAGQLLSRHAGDFDNGSPRVDYALLDINLYSNNKTTNGIYLGRIKNPIGLYNETRDVAHTREGIFLPQVIYFDKVRDLIISSDGLHLYSHIYLDSGTLLMQAGIGYPIADENVEYTYLGQNWEGSLNNDHLGAFGKILFEQDAGRWIYSLTGAQATIGFDAKGSDLIAFPYGAGLHSGKIEIDYTVLSTQYNGEKWQLTAEAAFEDVDYINISPAFSAQSTNSFGYFLQANYNINPQWQAFLRYEEFQLNNDDWDGKKAAQTSLANSQLLASYGINSAALPAYVNYTKAWALGGRWNINPKLMLRAEYQLIEGTATLSPRENIMALSHKNWDLFAVSLSYHF